MTTMTRTQESTAPTSCCCWRSNSATALGNWDSRSGWASGRGFDRCPPARSTACGRRSREAKRALQAGGRHAGDQLLRSGARRLLVPSGAGGARGDESRGGFVEHRSESAGAADEERSVGSRGAADAARPVGGGRPAVLARGAGAERCSRKMRGICIGAGKRCSRIARG